MKCEDCRYWVRNIGKYEGDGECRRNAPIPFNTEDLNPPNMQAYWPTTSYPDWCGEFKEREENKKAPGT